MAKKQKDLFGDFIKGLTRRFDFELWPDWIFFFRAEECLFQYGLNCNYLWCHRKKIWSVLGCEGQYSYDEVRSFIKKHVGQHFKSMGVISNAIAFDSAKGVEYHFPINSKQNKTKQ